MIDALGLEVGVQRIPMTRLVGMHDRTRPHDLGDESDAISFLLGDDDFSASGSRHSPFWLS